jgi:hypothetical protein
MAPPSNCTVKTFYISSGLRDKRKYPNGSDFTYELPATLNHVVGISIRDYKFSPESLINNANNTFQIFIDNGSTNVIKTLAVGNYNNSISDLIIAINVLLSTYQIAFSLNTSTNLVELTFTGPFVTDYVYLPASPILRFLGFPDGIVLYRSAVPTPSPPSPLFQTMAVASQAYDVYIMSDMVVRITDLETIQSTDAITNRSTAVLFNSQPNYVVKQCLDHYIPLLQIQSRLQALKIKLLNIEGDYYDTVNNDAAFILEVYCCNEIC